MRLRFTIRDLLSRKPQFRLMFLLLLTALFAAFFGWRAAVDRKHRLDFESQLETKDQLLAGQEMWVKHAQERDHQVSDQTDEGKERRAKAYESTLKKLAKEREQLRNSPPTP